MPYQPEDDEVPNPLREGLRGVSTPAPCAVVVFGASGDLTQRKLMPALYNLALGAHLPAAFGVVGVSKSQVSDEAFRIGMREAVEKHSRTKPIDEEVWSDFAAGMHYVAGDFNDQKTYLDLKESLDQLDRERATRGNRLYYFATPPSTFPTLLKNLKIAGLIRSINDDRFSRVVIEKPFGRDLDSARRLNRLVLEVVDERDRKSVV